MAKHDDLSRLDGTAPSWWLKILIFIISAGVSFAIFYFFQLWFLK